MSEKYKFHDPDGIYFVTMTIVDWIPVFREEIIIEQILDSLRFCQKEKGLVVHCWCIMPDHLHLIISRNRDDVLMGKIVRDFKKFTSKEIIKKLTSLDSIYKSFLNVFQNKASLINRNKNFKVWQDGSHPILLDTNFLLDQKVEYIHNNPVKAGLSESPEQYEWSSARDYFLETKGPIELEFIT